MTYQDKFECYNKHLTMQAAPLSDTVAQAAESANLVSDTPHMCVRKLERWTFYCH